MLPRHCHVSPVAPADVIMLRHCRLMMSSYVTATCPAPRVSSVTRPCTLMLMDLSTLSIHHYVHQMLFELKLEMLPMKMNADFYDLQFKSQVSSSTQGNVQNVA